MNRKRILAFFLSIAMSCTVAIAIGSGNIDGAGGEHSSGGMHGGSSQNYWNNESGVRITVLHDGKRVYVTDWCNQSESNVVCSFFRKSKLEYLHGAILVPIKKQYFCTVVAAKMPTIVGGSGGNDIAAIKRYFTDTGHLQSLANGTGIPYKSLTGGHYKLLLEPIAYFTFKGTKCAMTATEAAKYDVMSKGKLRAWMKSLTHKNLPLSMFLEKTDTELGLHAWTGAKHGYQNDANIINYLGMGVVSFKKTPEPEKSKFDYEFRTDTDVIVSFPITSGVDVTPDDNAYVVLHAGDTDYHRQYICPAGGTQLIWIRWHTPKEPQQMTLTANYPGGTVNLNVNIVKLEEKTPPDPTYYDRNDGFTPAAVPNYGNCRETTWNEWFARWIANTAEPDSETGKPAEPSGRWEFYQVSYFASLVVHKFKLLPDSRCKTAYLTGGGKSTMASGYGVQAQIEPKVQASDGVAANYDITPVQNMVATFPEFGYQTYDRLLEKVSPEKWAFRKNPCSYYNSRVHFTPIWYPDNQNYTVPVCMFDAWTPGGQLYATMNGAIGIYGSCLDDWYIHVTH